MNFDFASLITARQQRLYGYIHSLLDSSAAAWDVLQETNIVLWGKQAEFTPGKSFDAWAFTVARFQVLAWLRDRKREPLDLMTPELAELMAEDSVTEGELFEQRLAALQKCREGLHGRSRLLLELIYESGQSVRQVAEGLKIGSDAVKAPVEILIVVNSAHNWKDAGGTLQPSLDEIMTRTAAFMKQHLGRLPTP